MDVTHWLTLAAEKEQSDEFLFHAPTEAITFVIPSGTHLSVESRGVCHHHAQKADMPSVGSSPAQYQQAGSSGSLGPSAEPAEKAFFCADLDGAFVSCNAAFSRLFGY